jgi:hypothetical protein
VLSSSGEKLTGPVSSLSSAAPIDFKFFHKIFEGREGFKNLAMYEIILFFIFLILVLLGGLNGSVVYATACYPNGAGFDFRLMLGVFPSCKRS